MEGRSVSGMLQPYPPSSSNLQELGKGIKTAKQGDGRVSHEEAFRLCERHGY